MFTAGKPASLCDAAQAIVPTPAAATVPHPRIGVETSPDTTGTSAQCRRVFLISATLRILWGRQFCLQPPFRRLLGTLRRRQAPAKSRVQPGLAGPQFVQTNWKNFAASGTPASSTSSVRNAG